MDSMPKFLQLFLLAQFCPLLYIYLGLYFRKLHVEWKCRLVRENQTLFNFFTIWVQLTLFKRTPLIIHHQSHFAMCFRTRTHGQKVT